MKFVACPGCGANLDFGEKCEDCHPNEKTTDTPIPAAKN